MFEQQKDELLPRKNSRRETWCPGRSAWAPPPLPGVLTCAWCAPGHACAAVWHVSPATVLHHQPVQHCRGRRCLCCTFALQFHADGGSRKRPLQSLAALDEEASEMLMSAIGEEGEAEHPTHKSARHSSAAGESVGMRASSTVT
jgi:hypothetical protein